MSTISDEVLERMIKDSEKSVKTWRRLSMVDLFCGTYQLGFGVSLILDSWSKDTLWYLPAGVFMIVVGTYMEVQFRDCRKRMRIWQQCAKSFKPMMGVSLENTSPSRIELLLDQSSAAIKELQEL